MHNERFQFREPHGVFVLGELVKVADLFVHLGRDVVGLDDEHVLRVSFDRTLKNKADDLANILSEDPTDFTFSRRH